MPVHRALLRAGFLLILLSMVIGLAVPAFRNPRMAVNAHLVALCGGLLLIGLALSWGLLRLSPGLARAVRWLFLYAAYVNFAATCLGAAWGTSRLTPLGGSGFHGAAWQETVVQVLLASMVLATLVGSGLVVFALRPPGRETVDAATEVAGS